MLIRKQQKIDFTGNLARDGVANTALFFIFKDLNQFILF